MNQRLESLNSMNKRILYLIRGIESKYQIEVTDIRVIEKDNEILLECKIKKREQQEINIEEKEMCLNGDKLMILMKKGF